MSWVSRLQKINALSITEAEYVASTEAAKEMIWLQFFLEELGHPQKDNYLFTDSQSAIHLAKNSALHSKTKHIQLRTISFGQFWRMDSESCRRSIQMTIQQIC